MMNADVLEVPKFYVSVFGLVLSTIAGIVAFQSFRRNERWKKAEFLAREMKDFFGDKRIQQAMLLIDWGVRRIQLLPPEEANAGRVVVTRQMQISALRPHTFLHRSVAADPEITVETANSDSETTEHRTGTYPEGFTPAEAAVRDCYDAFLDGLERLSSYVQTGVADKSALPPYIGYWIDDIHAPTENKMDAAWSASLLTYISFYQFKGVLWLFDALDRNIRPTSSAYKGFLQQMEDQAFASRLSKSVEFTYLQK